MFSEGEINFEISPKMGLVLMSCFDMVGMAPPKYITSDRMAVVVDRINKTRQLMVEHYVFSAEQNNGKIKNVKVQNNDDVEDFKLIAENISNIKQKTAIISSKLGIIRSQLKIMLTAKGYKVFSVHDIKDLILILKKNSFDLVVTEINDFDDLLNLAKVRALMNDDAKLTALSSELKNLELRLGCKEIGVDIYIEKNGYWQKRLIYKLDSPDNKHRKYA